MKKVLIIGIIALIVAVLAIGAFNTPASAADEDYYTYTVSNGKATITDVDTSIGGDITIPSTIEGSPVTIIGNSAFYNCSQLTSIVIPEGVTTIGKYAFQNCEKLKSITIPESVTSIGNKAFYFCESLTSIEIPASVTSIGDEAFYNCGSLTSINISAHITQIGNKSFQNCDNLTSIVIPEGVTSIGDYAFGGCSSMISIYIPLSVKKIGDYAFYGCYDLTTVYYEGTITDWRNIDIVGSYNYSLTGATQINPRNDAIEKAISGTTLTTGVVGNETVIIVPTNNSVAMTESELADIFDDESITITSNNGIIGTGCKVTIGEYEVDLVVKGDIDGDGVVTVFDALMVKKALANNGFENEALREFAGDVDGVDGTTEDDIRALLSYIVGTMSLS